MKNFPEESTGYKPYSLNDLLEALASQNQIHAENGALLSKLISELMPIPEPKKDPIPVPNPSCSIELFQNLLDQYRESNNEMNRMLNHLASVIGV